MNTYEPEYPDATLYILMRDDMDSMNSGKGMAQAAHAANQFAKHHGSAMCPGYEDWEMQSKSGFGTTIVLAATGEEHLRFYVQNALKLGHPADVVLDDTYPVRDGDVTHLIPVITCGYVFLRDRNDTGGVLIEGLELHP